MQKSEEMSVKPGKVERKSNSELITNEMKQSFAEICDQYKLPGCPDEETLQENSEGATNQKEILPNLTDHMVDDKKKDASKVPISGEIQALPEGKDPRLKNGFPCESYSGSPEYAKKYTSVEPGLENVISSPSHSDKVSEIHLEEELQQDMQTFKNEVGMLQAELVALEKEKIPLQKEVELHLLLLLFVFSLYQLSDPFSFSTSENLMHV